MFKLIHLSFFFGICNSLAYDKPVFVTGATSTVGRRVVQKLNLRGVTTKCLTRDISKGVRIFGKTEGIQLVEGDILNSEQLSSLMTECSLSVNLHGVNRLSNPFHKLPFLKFTNKIEDKNHPYYINYISMKNIISSCKQNDISRMIRITGLATASPDYHFWPFIINSLYSNQVYWHREAETEIINSGIKYTILRPGGIRDKEFDSVELKESMTKPPSLIGIENLADIVVRSILPSKSSFEKPYIFENKIVACRGYNNPS